MSHVAAVASTVAFWVAVGAVGLACLVGLLVLLFPAVGRFLRSVKW